MKILANMAKLSPAAALQVIAPWTDKLLPVGLIGTPEPDMIRGIATGMSALALFYFAAQQKQKSKSSVRSNLRHFFFILIVCLFALIGVSLNAGVTFNFGPGWLEVFWSAWGMLYILSFCLIAACLASITHILFKLD